jgi:hypothetical protein
MGLLKRAVTAAKFLYSHLRNPSSHTYYPHNQRKSNIEIYFDNLWWMMRYCEINHFYYLYGLDRKDGGNPDDYLALRTFRRLRDRANLVMEMGGRKANCTCLLRDKFVFGKYLKVLGFPTPEIIALCDGQSIMWLDTQKTESFESLLRRDRMDVFIKELMGECADGVYSIRTEDGKLYLNEQQVTVEELKKTIKDKCIVQERIYQHQKMSELYPHSVNTIRLVTAISGKEIITLGAIIRIGVNGQCCDNLAAGGVSAPIDLETGRLGKEGLFRPAFGRRTTHHPNTGVVFYDFQIPYFAEAVQKATRLHNFFYGIHSIGWDIAITKDGPVFIEGNDNWEIPTFQAYDRHFKKKFLAVLPKG